MSPSFLQEIFTKNINLASDNVSANTRSKSLFYNYKAPKTRKYGLETIRCLGPKIFNMLPEEIKLAATYGAFKSKVKKWIKSNISVKP